MTSNMNQIFGLASCLQAFGREVQALGFLEFGRDFESGWRL